MKTYVQTKAQVQPYTYLQYNTKNPATLLSHCAEKMDL